VKELVRTLRIAGVVIGIALLLQLVWIVLLGPAALVLTTPR